ncbi:MAG TPA: amidohydrolase [Thermoanaerobaculia bacterium]|nr:amidohydrolase [Thermoanaerobaculia bacterium]
MSFFCGLLLSLLAAAAPGGADSGLLLEGATLYVSADAKPSKGAVLVRDGRIAFAGDAAQARKMAPSASRVDLSGAFVFAGWADAHGHLEGLGKSLESADLRGAPTAAEAARRMASAAQSLPAGTWAEGRGWDQNRWPGQAFPDARELDAALPDRPAAARRVDGHALWVNTAALKAARIDASTKDPEGGRIVRRADGSPSGVFVDRAMGLVDAAMPPSTPADFERRILAATRACARRGLTEVQDASRYGREEIAGLARLADAGELPIRVYATVTSDPAALADFFAKGPRIGKGSDFLTVRAIKVLADGALGSRGAALLSDYSDEPGNRGLLVTPPERLDELARDARGNGWQLWVHAIGDRGNRNALDAFAKAAAAVPRPPAGGTRPRIEHAQILAAADIPRFGREGVIASMQPTHATSDMPWAEKRVGPDRISGAYAWRKLKKAGARLAGGSDFPVESENPVLGFYAAVTRQDPAGNPPGGWLPQERLTRAEALALFTSDAAYAAFEEDRRGKIAPGFEADLTVFARDPMTVPEKEIPALVPLMTVVGGRVVWGSGLSGEKAP